jgi:hypothetical protein
VKIFRFLIINIILLFIIVTTISLFIPSHVRISRAVNMSSSSAAVLQNVDDIAEWKYWYPGFDTLKVEPLQLLEGKLVSVKIPGTVISISNRTKDEVTAAFKSGNKNPVISGWKTIGYSHTDSLTVQWYLDFQLRWYPWEKFTSLLYEKTYGVQMEAGLNNLKKMAER